MKGKAPRKHSLHEKKIKRGFRIPFLKNTFVHIQCIWQKCCLSSTKIVTKLNKDIDVHNRLKQNHLKYLETGYKSMHVNWQIDLLYTISKWSNLHYHKRRQILKCKLVYSYSNLIIGWLCPVVSTNGGITWLSKITNTVGSLFCLNMNIRDIHNNIVPNLLYAQLIFSIYLSKVRFCTIISFREHSLNCVKLAISAFVISTQQYFLGSRNNNVLKQK